MKKPKLDWYENLLVRMLQRRGMHTASIIIQEAYPGYSVKKQRSDKGKRKGGGENGRESNL